MNVNLPDIDLAALHDPHHPEWAWGDAGYPTHGALVTATEVPDEDGATVRIWSGLSLPREKLPELAALLMAVYQDTSQDELDIRYGCDCEPEGLLHEPYCASLNDPRVTS